MDNLISLDEARKKKLAAKEKEKEQEPKLPLGDNI